MDGLRNLWGDFKTSLTTDRLQTNQTFVRSMQKMYSQSFKNYITKRIKAT